MSKDDKASEAAPAKPRSFTIKTPNPGFKGERHGVKFADGVATTDDAIRAHAFLEFGYEVLDADTGKPAWSDEPDTNEDDGVKRKPAGKK